MSIGSLLKNEVFSISTICLVAIPLIIAFTGDKQVQDTAKNKAGGVLPAITKNLPKTDITKTIGKSFKMVKDTVTGKKTSNKKKSSYKKTGGKKKTLYINKNR